MHHRSLGGGVRAVADEGPGVFDYPDDDEKSVYPNVMAAGRADVA